MGADVLHLHRQIRPGSRSARGRTAILADLDALHEQQRILYDELAHADEAGAAHGDPPQQRARQSETVALVVEGPIVCRKRAAEAIGWREDRLTAAIIRHNNRYPEDPIGWQAGGNRRARWEIPLGRLLRFVQNRPAASSTAKPGETR
ncbi:hypothetical protein R1A27_06450 [Methylobacterium sp. NMS12]|uniref:hypothetical protein n=1 Tax=Methylobacterium sp. NMS12 TaxID=3079766 RepID=UPI003F88499A